VVAAICDKMERRHPHVFGTESFRHCGTTNHRVGETQRRERAAAPTTTSVLDNVPVALPALMRAAKLGKRAAAVGFEWPDVQGALDKVDEELKEYTTQSMKQHPLTNWKMNWATYYSAW